MKKNLQNEELINYVVYLSYKDEKGYRFNLLKIGTIEEIISYINFRKNIIDDCVSSCVLSITSVYNLSKIKNKFYIEDQYIIDHILESNKNKIKIDYWCDNFNIFKDYYKNKKIKI